MRDLIKTKRESAITLIALVVTIVILIILATVSINMVFQENGLIDRTNAAKEQQALGEEKERLELIKPVVAMKNKGEVKVDKYIQELIEQGITSKEEVEENADGSKQFVTDRGYDVNVKQDGDNNVIITINGKVEGLPVRIVGIKLTVNSNNIKVDVDVRRAEGATYKYYYKTADTEYVLVKETKELNCIINNTNQNTTYKIKVEATNKNGTSYKEVMTVADAEGNIIFGDLQWNNGKAQVSITKAASVESTLKIEYKVNTGNYIQINSGGIVGNLNLNDIVTVRLTDGVNYGSSASLTVVDIQEPEATITLSSNTTDTDSSITAKVEQIDGQSGIDITKCKWVYNTENKNIGTNESSYPNSFTKNPETLALSQILEGTYYLHVLTIDKIGNRKETISEAVTVEIEDTSIKPVPKLSDGMIPVKWNGSNWIKTTQEDSSWYNYASKEWANIVLGDSTFNGDILDESKPYSQLVWIPRYAYRITSGWHSNKAGTIEVVFVDTNNQDKKGTAYNGTYAEATSGVTSRGAMKNHVIHPAFDYGGTKLQGFWMAKYESSNTECTTDRKTGNLDYTGNEILQIKANVTSWRKISMENAFDVCLNMNKENNPYRLSSNDNIVDPHLIKNTEWGAIAYLNMSRQGTKSLTLDLNNSSDFITGNSGGDPEAVSAASVTNPYHSPNAYAAAAGGTIYGVYDLHGGAAEFVCAYIKPSTSEWNRFPKINNAPERYKNVYDYGTRDESKYNYAKTATKYGDAIYEVSQVSSASPDLVDAWYGSINMPTLRKWNKTWWGLHS